MCYVSASLKKKPVGDLLVADALGCHFLAAKIFICGTDHSRCENICKHVCFEAIDAVHGIVVMSQRCVSV